MADHELSSDLEQPQSPPTPQPDECSSCKEAKKHSKRPSKSGKPSSSKVHKPSSAEAKDAKRRHDALERRFDQAQRKVQPPAQPAVLPDAAPSPATATATAQLAPSVPPPGDPVWVLPPHEQEAGTLQQVPPTLPSSSVPLTVHPSICPMPEAAFTPTAAGLRLPESQQPLYCDLQAMISATLSYAGVGPPCCGTTAGVTASKGSTLFCTGCPRSI